VDGRHPGAIVRVHKFDSLVCRLVWLKTAGAACGIIVSMKWQLLHKACWQGDDREVSRLLDCGADPNQVAPTTWRQTPLGRTLEFRVTTPRHSGHVETVRVLLERGANPAVRSTYLDMTPWELAAFCGLEPAAELLCAFRPANPHPSGMTDLWLASASRLPEPTQLEAVRRLSDGRNVDSAWRKATPLMMAVGHAAHFQVGDQLLKAGADPNAGISILHASCDWHFEHLVSALRYLARMGWDVNSRDSAGQTALHKAAFLGYVAAVRVLLDQGADPGVKDFSGLTPIDLAHQWNKPAAAKALARAA
jgi:ankyrin repeat protein